ncbi:MAG: LPS biosynthesis protein [Gammaproteobacteria bacterium]|nr:LPS biosynthesis protein [Gammaproteobacteria bacterium]
MEIEKVLYCKKCVYPSSSATPLTFDDEGVCSGCRVSEQKEEIDWNERFQKLKELTSEYKNEEGYDILIPVSGGKDSYFQTHIATKELGLKALLVTYHGNNYLPEGEYNLFRMREVFDADHIIVRPSIEILRKMNRLGFRVQGDMNWHVHCGIFSVPIQAAVKYKVPLILWGEHGFMDLGGMHSYNDFVEFTAKYRKEHALRGYDWDDFTDKGLEKLGFEGKYEQLREKDLLWAKYPSDDDIFEIGVRGIYLSNYVDWNGDKNADLMKKLYNWRGSNKEFQRTYRTSSNLDDMHENGIHDYLKFIKVGYGRTTDHCSKDIRAGKMSRSQAIEEVKKRDHVLSDDLKRWLEYVDITEKDFLETCDTFRDPRVWWVQDGEWWKDNLWGDSSSYGKVNLPKHAIQKYVRT